jgi:hypothetical protein
MIYADGSVLRGNWVDDAINGRGELERPTGKTLIGEWKDNQIAKVISEK